MRRFLSISFFALALMIGATGAAPVAHAGLTDATDGCPIGQAKEPDLGNCVASADLATQNAATAAAKKAAADTPTAINPNIDNSILASVMVWLQSLFAWLLGVAAITLDNAVYYTIVTMGTYVKNLTAIGVTWRILRDIGNIMLIFGFLAIGISVILNTERIGYGKKMLPMLLVAAVFLNFSLFFSEAIIDTGNLFATQFYTQINGGNAAGAKNFDLTSVSSEGISNKIMAQLGLAAIYSRALTNSSVLKGTNVSAISFMSIILFIIAAFVMFSLAFILIARFVMLIFLIILAPVGFAGLAVPQLKGQADKWWGALFRQTITAPILLLLLYVALAVITDAHFLGFGPSADWVGFVPNPDGSTNFTGFASMMLSFLVAMGLLLAVTISAKSLSAFGASKATALASKLSGASLAAAAPGWVGRNTVGAGGNYAAKKLRNTAFGRSFVGRGIAGTLEKNVAGASFDIRNTSVGKSAAGAGLSLGKGQTGGYTADLKARVASYEKAGDAITGRAQTKEEKESIAKAEENHTRAKAGNLSINSHKAAVQETEEQQAEIDRLKKERDADPYWQANSGREQKISAAEQSLSIAKAKQDSLEPGAKKAAENIQKAKEEEEKVKANIKTATSAESAKKDYADRLEKWGKLPFNSAATQAAKNIVKTKTQKDLEKIQKFLAESDKPKEKEKETEASAPKPVH